MMKKLILIYCLLITCFLSITISKAQDVKASINTIKTNSRIWDKAFNTRDTNVYYKLIDTGIALTAGGGTYTGIAVFKNDTKNLYADRPDIIMYLNITNVEVNKQWHIAYDTGDWTENWTEKNDSSKSEIKGKYWRMWKMENNGWRIISIILTPLFCKGSYCK